MFDTLTEKLQNAFQRLSSRGTITEKDLDEALREVRLALLEADVHFKVVRDFVARVRARALDAQVTTSLTPMQQIVETVNAELISVLGGSQARLSHASVPPSIYMLVGMKGAGKTTTAAKLALHLRRQGQQPILVAADSRRVAAAEQIEALAGQLNIPSVDVTRLVGNPADLGGLVTEATSQANATAVVVDTAGYVRMDGEEMAELLAIHRAIQPLETLLVADAMTGQEAVSAAEQFHNMVGLNGLILTKIDGDARGGAALSIRAVTGIPIKFTGTGEKPDALEPFHPDRLASRILGMGDVLTLVERARDKFSENEVTAVTKRMRKGALTLEDFLSQFQRVRSMGPLNQIASMLPGLSSLAGKMESELDDRIMDRAQAIIYSMTPEERRNPAIIDGQRRRRIARGSGTQPADVNRLIKQYDQARRLMQRMTSGRGPNLPFPLS